jgi:hypothetical protein
MRAPTAWFRRGPSSHFVTEVRLHPRRPVEVPAIDRIRTFVDDLGRDLQYALRMLIKTPLLTGVTLLTLVTLVLGIGAGALLGLGLSFIAARLLSALMFGVAANDAVTFASVVVLMFLGAIAASLIPAPRATRACPMEALRS